jgi:hypothetical protein
MGTKHLCESLEKSPSLQEAFPKNPFTTTGKFSRAFGTNQVLGMYKTQVGMLYSNLKLLQVAYKELTDVDTMHREMLTKWFNPSDDIVAMTGQELNKAFWSHINDLRRDLGKCVTIYDAGYENADLNFADLTRLITEACHASATPADLETHILKAYEIVYDQAPNPGLSAADMIDQFVQEINKIDSTATGWSEYILETARKLVNNAFSFGKDDNDAAIGYIDGAAKGAGELRELTTRLVSDLGVSIDGVPNTVTECIKILTDRVQPVLAQFKTLKAHVPINDDEDVAPHNVMTRAAGILAYNDNLVEFFNYCAGRLGVAGGTQEVSEAFEHRVNEFEDAGGTSEQSKRTVRDLTAHAAQLEVELRAAMDANKTLRLRLPTEDKLDRLQRMAEAANEDARRSQEDAAGAHQLLMDEKNKNAQILASLESGSPSKSKDAEIDSLNATIKGLRRKLKMADRPPVAALDGKKRVCMEATNYEPGFDDAIATSKATQRLVAFRREAEQETTRPYETYSQLDGQGVKKDYLVKDYALIYTRGHLDNTGELMMVSINKEKYTDWSRTRRVVDPDVPFDREVFELRRGERAQDHVNSLARASSDKARKRGAPRKEAGGRPDYAGRDPEHNPASDKRPLLEVLTFDDPKSADDRHKEARPGLLGAPSAPPPPPSKDEGGDSVHTPEATPEDGEGVPPPPPIVHEDLSPNPDDDEWPVDAEPTNPAEKPVDTLATSLKDQLQDHGLAHHPDFVHKDVEGTPSLNQSPHQSVYGDN